MSIKTVDVDGNVSYGDLQKIITYHQTGEYKNVDPEIIPMSSRGENYILLRFTSENGNTFTGFTRLATREVLGCVTS